MGLLKPASGGSYLKAGVLGFAKSGKTHTSVEIACGVREYFKLPGPIAFYDTETGSNYWKSRVKARTGLDLMVVKSRSLPDLIEVVNECVESKASVLIVDSITHVWREVCDAYLAELKAAAQRKRWKEPERLEFQDWARIKSRWATWPDLYLNSPLHIIVCGRAGFEYDMQVDDRGKKELVKTGIKMKVEGEFGFEPSLLIEMERDWTEGDTHEMVARATVIGDRFDLLNGKTCDQPTFEFFRPFVEQLTPSDHSEIDTGIKTTFGLDAHRDDDWKREKDRREILSEKILAAISMAGLDGRGAEDKKIRSELFLKFWSSTSWKEISEKTSSNVLDKGLRQFQLEHGLLGDDDVPTDFSAKDQAPAAPSPDAKEPA